MDDTEGRTTTGGEVVVYEAPDGGPRVEVVVQDETVWLTQRQMADLFGTTVANVSLHARNAFEEGELREEATVKESLMVRTEGKRRVRRRIRRYNLDVIISVGYRVKSKRGTQFRIWANGVLRDYLLHGYALNERRLLARGVEFDQAVALLVSTLERRELVTAEGQAVLDVIRRYARTWRILRAYDDGALSASPARTLEPLASLDLETARWAIRMLRDDIVERGEEPGLFGQERGDALESILLNIEQTWDGNPLYPTVESRAAHLLYFVIKDHPLADGNKRTASLLFLEYLRRNGALLRSDGAPRFSDTALVALTLLVAESEPSHKDLVIRLVLNLLAEDHA